MGCFGHKGVFGSERVSGGRKGVFGGRNKVFGGEQMYLGLKRVVGV